MKEYGRTSERELFANGLGSKVAKVALVTSALLALAGCAGVAEPLATPAAPTTQAPAPSADEAIAAEGTFNVSVFDLDENQKTYPDFEVWIRNSGSWFPSFEFGGDLLESVGPFPVGELSDGDLYIYPFGRSGLEISVPIRLSDEHISDSTRDMLSIAIEDGVLTVSGTVLDGARIEQNLD